MVENFDELISNMSKEKSMMESHDRYPVRFIFLPLYKELLQYILSLSSELGLRIKKLSEFFPPDKWVTWDYLYEMIEKEICDTDSDILFLGLSEYLRFCKRIDVETSFLNLIGLENSLTNRREKRRVYFLMDSFNNYLQKIIRNNHHRNIFYNPIIGGESLLKAVGTERPRLIIISNLVDNSNLISTVRDYIDIPARTDYFDLSKPLWCNSKTIISLSRKNTDFINDALFEYICAVNPIQILKIKLDGVNFESSLFDDSEFVSWLSTKILVDSDQINLRDLLNSVVNIQSDSPFEIVYLYASCSDANEKKLIRLYIENNSNNDLSWGFINHLIQNNKIANKYELIKSVYLSCNDSVVVNSFFDERIKLIDSIVSRDNYIEAPESLIDIYNNELTKIIRSNYIVPSDFSISIKDDVRTNILKLSSSEEKLEHIFSSFKDNFVMRTITSFSLVEKRIIILMASKSILKPDDLKNLYPDLYGYLYYVSSGLEKNRFLDCYFSEYKQSKISMNPTAGYLKILNEVSPGWFLNLYNSPDYKNVDNYLKAKHIFVLDGVGAEYISLLTYMLEIKCGINISKACYRKALLPTTTSINKELIDSLSPTPIWYREFDSEIIHKDFYSVEKNIEKAISLIERMTKRMINESNGESFLIIADHGCTVSHKIMGAAKKYSAFANSEHDGRCCRIENGQQFEESLDGDYLKFKDRSSNDWIIPIKHISLDKTPKYEAHGGGTMEEVFVPYIYVPGSSDDSLEINIIKKEVSGRDRTFKFTINAEIDPDEITIIEETGCISNPIFSDGIYIVNLSVGKTQKVTIRINNHEEVVYVQSNSGINKNNGGFF